MTVINPSSISGITSITMPSGDGNVLTIHTNDGTERFRIDSSGNVKVGSACTISQDGDVFFTGVTTATTFTGAHSGSGANLTSLPAAQLTGTLPAISGANLTGIAATDNVRTGILDVAGVSTFRNTMNVGAAVTISESGIEASGIGITCANINGGAIGGRRNLIINGAMEVAQRGTSSTGTTYGLDRMKQEHSGTDEAPTYAQVDVSSGTTPYTEGFRKALKITNGNQTSGAGSSDYVYWWTVLEAQNVAKSGWNYTSASSFITISFWIKSSVAQNFYGFLQTADGTSQSLAYETGSLTADTWTKIVKTIPGNSNLQFDNDANAGLYWAPARAFDGTDRTASMSLDTWATYSGSSRTPDATSTWYTTNDATLEITGLQMEVGPQATAFEHRSFGEELALCQRYFYMHAFGSGVASPDSSPMGVATQYSITSFFGPIQYPVRMRAHPSFYKSLGTDRLLFFASASSQGFDDVASQDFGVNSSIVNYYDSLNSSAAAGWVQLENTYTSSYVGFDAEL